LKKLAILAAAAGFVAGAQAQTLETSISVRGGVQFPTTADLSGVFWGLGADVNLTGVSIFRNATSYVSVDWISKNLKFNRNFIIPICLNQRFALNTTPETMVGPSTYAFFGVGAAIIDVGNASTQLCARAGLGADFSPSIYGEASIVFTGRAKNSGVQGNHLGLWLGYRF
jgi:hypothetical protein